MVDVVGQIEGIEVASRLKIGGLLVIDTPGHEAFMNLRKRGGSIADFAILVIDITAGVMPQTIESIEILRSRKTPFVIAANKIDLTRGWRPSSSLSFLKAIKEQEPGTGKLLEQKLYDIVGQVSKLGLTTDLFYSLSDFKDKNPVVPVSAKTGEGIAELIAVMSGMIQSFQTKSLETKSNRGKGVVLEVTEDVGLGTTINVIVYDGIIKVGDSIALTTLTGPTVTKVRALLSPKPLDEIRDPRDRFDSVAQMRASSGIKLSGPDLAGALAGSSVIVCNTLEEQRRAIEELSQEVSSILFKTEIQGIILKADTLGALEAIVPELQSKAIKVRMADIGPVTKKDVIGASTASGDMTQRVIIAFNVDVTGEAEEAARDLGVRIMTGKVIYGLMDEYFSWKTSYEKATAEELFSKLVTPAKLFIMPGFVFRRSKPAIFGVRVEKGLMRQGSNLISEGGERIGAIDSIRLQDQSVNEAKKGDEVSISIKEAVMGRNVQEGETLYVEIRASDAISLKTNLSQFATQDMLDAIEEITKIKRQKEPYWGYLK